MSDNFNEFIDYSDARELTMKEKIKDVFTNPIELFKSIKFYPNLKLPIIIILVISFLAAFIEISSTDFISSMIDSAKQSGQPIPNDSQLEIYKYMTIALAGVMPLVVIGFKAFMITGLSVLVGGDGDTKEGMLVTSYSYIPIVLGTLIARTIVYFTNFDVFKFNLAQILPASLEGSLFFGIALSIDVFIIWYLVLSFIGTKYIFEISYKKAILPVLIPWIFWVIFYAGVYVLTSGGLNLGI
ncbi:YIP1 family protein [Senegalia massiliensis]|uniref:YIP1 family protein n=1 Tax=Senegalia massiliensis TaxID=1720316 RepID=UPI0010314C6A|nr:YIP1 family protein [Senegalia massiliensis]